MAAGLGPNKCGRHGARLGFFWSFWAFFSMGRGRQRGLCHSGAGFLEILWHFGTRVAQKCCPVVAPRWMRAGVAAGAKTGMGTWFLGDES